MLKIINNQHINTFSFFESNLANFCQSGLFILVLEFDIFFPEINVTLAEEQPVPKKLFNKVVVVLYDNVAQNVYAFNHLLLEDGRDQNSLDDQFFEKGQILKGLDDLVDLLVGEEVVGDFLCPQDLGVAVLKVLILEGEMLEVVVSALLDFFHHKPFQLVELAHHKSQVVAFHLCANVFFNGINFHEEHREELIFGVQTVHDHRNHILQNKVLLIPKVVNTVNGSACECG